jgi:cytochrome b
MAIPDTKILVWDAPIRTFHWLLVSSFFGAYLSAESETWRLLHVTLGYTMGGLIAFRVVWGVLGTRYARFGSFVRGPGTVGRYIKSVLAGKPTHYIGHNPAGAIAIVLMLALGLAIVATGYAVYNDIGGELFGELHEGAANMMIVLVGVHLAGVVFASYLHHENLPRAMVTGTKQGQPADGIARAWWSVALALVLAVAAYWYVQWRDAPQVVAQTQRSSTAHIAQ